MPEIIGFGITVLIIYFISELVKKFLAGVGRSNQSHPQGDVIDISNAWIDLHDLPYDRKSGFFSPIEAQLYNHLHDLLSGSGFIVFPKTRLAEILDLKPQAQHQQEYLRRIRERSCDFLICREPGTIPELIILVESRQDSQSVQQNRDFVQRAAAAAEFPLILVNLDNTPDQTDLRRILTKAGLLF